MRLPSPFGRGLTVAVATPFVLVATMLFAGAAGASAVEPFGHAGRWITDARGRVVILHGFNAVGKVAPFHPAANFGFDDDDAAMLAAEGFNSVRLGVIYEGLEPEPGVYGRRYIERLRETVRVLAAHGIASLLDMHQDLYGSVFGGDGFPPWATTTGSSVLDLPLRYGSRPGSRLLLPQAYDSFWRNRPAPDGVGIQDHYVRALGVLAQAFRDEPGVAGYDLFNEPFAGSDGGACVLPSGCEAFERNRLGPFMAKSMAAVRRADPRHLAFIEPQGAAALGRPTFVPAPKDRLGGFSFHDYCIFLQPPGATSGPCGRDGRRVLHDAVERAKTTREALMVSEWGANDDPLWLTKSAEALDAEMLSWQEWTYYNCCGSGARAREGILIDPSKPASPENLQQAKLDILARAYPRVIAGTPVGWSFDQRRRAFAFVYRTRRVGGGPFNRRLPTEIVLPARQYPTGRQISVQGAAITSRPEAALLRLVACPGSKLVVVRVNPPTVGGPKAAPRSCTRGQALGRRPARRPRTRP